MKFNCLIKRDTLKNWIDYNPVLKDKELVAIYDEGQLCGYKIGDGRNTWCDLNYTNLADLGEFRIYVDKDDTVIMVNLDPGLFALNLEPGVYRCADKPLRGQRARLVKSVEEEPIPVKIKVASYDEVNKNGTVLKK